MINQNPQWLDYTRWNSARWKTAIHRTTLSRPIKLAVARKIIHHDCQLLDLGCGHRSDCNILNKHGINAIGFDPYYYPQFELIRPTEVISLCFVVNTIECPVERREVLQWAWKLTQEWLIIAVQQQTPSKNKIGEVRTKRNTFQKYYTQNQITEFVGNTVKPRYIESKTGIVFACK